MVSAVRKAVESLYNGLCDIIEYRNSTDPVTKITAAQEVQVCTAQKCRLSFKSSPPIGESQTADTVQQITKLFIAPEVEVKAGSKIVVTQNGVTKAYQRSGEPAIYETHQEIVLELFKGWA